MQQNKRKRRIIYEYKRLLRKFNDGAEFVAFDTETTGLRAADCRIIELGAVRFSMQGVLGSFHTLINPCCPLPKIITQITGITDEMLCDKPEIRSLIGGFMQFSAGAYLVAHNAGFDIKFLNTELERCGLPPATNLIVDTLNFSRRVFPEFEHHNLQFLAQKLGITVTAAHRADDDARVCMELFLKELESYKHSIQTEFIDDHTAVCPVVD